MALHTRMLIGFATGLVLGLIVHVTAGGDAEWGALVCRNADGLLMIAEAGASPALNPNPTSHNVITRI